MAQRAGLRQREVGQPNSVQQCVCRFEVRGSGLAPDPAAVASGGEHGELHRLDRC
jgi:hypothetical protein